MDDLPFTVSGCWPKQRDAKIGYTGLYSVSITTLVIGKRFLAGVDLTPHRRVLFGVVTSHKITFLFHY